MPLLLSLFLCLIPIREIPQCIGYGLAIPKLFTLHGESSEGRRRYPKESHALVGFLKLSAESVVVPEIHIKDQGLSGRPDCCESIESANLVIAVRGADWRTRELGRGVYVGHCHFVAHRSTHRLALRENFAGYGDSPANFPGDSMSRVLGRDLNIGTVDEFDGKENISAHRGFHLVMHQAGLVFHLGQLIPHYSQLAAINTESTNSYKGQGDVDAERGFFYPSNLPRKFLGGCFIVAAWLVAYLASFFVLGWRLWRFRYKFSLRGRIIVGVAGFLITAGFFAHGLSLILTESSGQSITHL